MKICLIVDDYMPDSIKVAAKMMHELAIELYGQGHEITVITPNPTITKKVDIIELDNITIYRFKSGIIKNTSKIKRAINETLLSYKAWTNCKPLLKDNKHDLIVYYSPSIFFGPLVRKLKKLWNCKSYLILRDLFPQWAIDNKIISENSIITKYFKFFESINYTNADKIGLMSQKNLDWFKENFNTFKNTEVLYNWSSNQKFNGVSSFRKDLNLQDKIIYFYGGNIGHAQDMLNLAKLAKNMLKYKNAHFLFLGEGDEVEILKKYKQDNNLINTTILPSVNQEKFKEFLSDIDVGLFSLNYNHKTHNFPGKLLGYMNESKPILGSINPNNDLKQIIENGKAGYITVNGEDKLLLGNAISLLENKERKIIGENANILLDNYFSVQSAANKILNIAKGI